MLLRRHNPHIREQVGNYMTERRCYPLDRARMEKLGFVAIRKKARSWRDEVPFADLKQYARATKSDFLYEHWLKRKDVIERSKRKP